MIVKKTKKYYEPKGFIWIDGNRYYTVEEMRKYMHARIDAYFDRKDRVF